MTVTGFIKRCTDISTLLIVAGFLFALLGPATGVREAAAADIPEWIQNFKLKGDIRLRYQGQETDPGENERQRYRIRFRPGVTAKVTDNGRLTSGLPREATTFGPPIRPTVNFPPTTSVLTMHMPPMSLQNPSSC